MEEKSRGELSNRAHTGTRRPQHGLESEPVAMATLLRGRHLGNGDWGGQSRKRTALMKRALIGSWRKYRPSGVRYNLDYSSTVSAAFLRSSAGFWDFASFVRHCFSDLVCCGCPLTLVSDRLVDQASWENGWPWVRVCTRDLRRRTGESAAHD